MSTTQRSHSASTPSRAIVTPVPQCIAMRPRCARTSATRSFKSAGETSAAAAARSIVKPASAVRSAASSLASQWSRSSCSSAPNSNSAFAFAFGYRSPAELLEAGGLRAILPNGAPLTQGNGLERSAPIEALTRSRRKLTVAFALTALDGDVKLLRLIDQARRRRFVATRISGQRQPRAAHAAQLDHRLYRADGAGALRTDRQRPLQGLCR